MLVADVSRSGDPERPREVNASNLSVHGGRAEGGPSLPALFLAASLVFAAVGLALVLQHHPLSLALVLALGLALFGALALVLANYEVAVAIGFLLLAAVRFEPGPADVLFAVAIAVAAVTGHFDLRRIPLVATGLIGVFFTINVLSAVEAVDVPRAARFLLITLYLGLFALWLAGYAQSERRARLIVRAYLAAAVVSAAIGSLALFVPFPGHEVFVFAGHRAEGFFKDPNVFAPFLIPPALILIEETFSPRLLRISRPTKVALVLILTLGVFLSYSRGAWLNFAVGLVVMFLVLGLRRGGGRKAIILLFWILATIGAAIAVVAVTGSIAFLEERARFQEYDVTRFNAQSSSIQLAWTHPVGIGPGQFEVVSPVSAHSLFVRALVEGGLLALVIVLALSIVTLAWAGREAILGRRIYGIGSVALLSAWCGLLANSLVIDTLHFRHLWVVAALIWAGAAAAARSSSARPAFA
jgi:hypothetical protein